MARSSTAEGKLCSCGVGLCLTPALVAVTIFEWDARDSESALFPVWSAIFAAGVYLSVPAGVVLRLRVDDESKRGPVAWILRGAVVLWALSVAEFVLVLSWDVNVAAVRFAVSLVT